jgi:hypothetical protein
MKLTSTKIVILVILALALMGAMIVNEGGSTSKYMQVRQDSVHAYYQPDVEANMVGWFVENEPLEVQRKDGNWWLVSGNGTDMAGHQTRMTGWVQATSLVAYAED